MLRRVPEELHSTSDVAKADDIELKEIAENAAKEQRISMHNSRENLPRIYPCANFWAWTNNSGVSEVL